MKFYRVITQSNTQSIISGQVLVLNNQNDVQFICGECRAGEMGITGHYQWILKSPSTGRGAARELEE